MTHTSQQNGTDGTTCLLASTTNLAGFSGKERDAETGLDYFGARYFSGAQGRFTGPVNFLNDTTALDPQRWNLYAYARNNPLRYMDPSGEKIYAGDLSDEDRDELLRRINATYGCKGCASVDKTGYLQVDTSGLSKQMLAATDYLTGAINSTSFFARVQVQITTRAWHSERPGWESAASNGMDGVSTRASFDSISGMIAGSAEIPLRSKRSSTPSSRTRSLTSSQPS
jgi:RHS repeat-associated protein